MQIIATLRTNLEIIDHIYIYRYRYILPKLLPFYILLANRELTSCKCFLDASISSVFANLPRILGWLSANAFLQAYLIFLPKFLLVLLFLYLESFSFRSSEMELPIICCVRFTLPFPRTFMSPSLNDLLIP
nr:hypothetical protein Iba_scaffold1678056CG0010 [Ipomoea batatas]